MIGTSTKKDSKESKRIAFFLPNTFTALNMACGFLSVIYSFQGEFYKACMILFLGAIFDSVDGRIARITGTQSQFGEQFDSISDVISFGIAPALLAYNRFFFGLGRVGIVVTFIFCLCGALRLARFNANIEKVSSEYFQGLPIPAAAMAVIGYVLLSLEFPMIADWNYISIAYVLLYGVLMISNIPFYSFKNSAWVRNHKKAMLFFIFLMIALTFMHEHIMIPGVMSIYVVISLIYFFTHKGELSNVFEWKNEEKDND
jgi:CDP-diacylglycerol--serine O-phosphatidyltransferase